MRFKHADGIDSDKELLVKRKEHHNTTYLVKVLGTFNVSAGKNRE